MSSIIKIVADILIIGVNCFDYYKRRNIYNILFILFFAAELARVCFEKSFFVTGVNTFVNIFEAVVSVGAIVMLIRESHKKDKIK